MKLSDSTKVTLTIGQIKSLVKEVCHMPKRHGAASWWGRHEDRGNQSLKALYDLEKQFWDCVRTDPERAEELYHSKEFKPVIDFFGKERFEDAFD